jgi:hypothetical protein
LRVWRDLNADAKIDAGELQTLGQAGVASIKPGRADSISASDGNLPVGEFIPSHNCHLQL